MKNLKTILITLLIMTIISCQKKPEASFTIDKSEYIAGETVHCKDASTNAYSWKWTAPDGKTYTSQNLDYLIDSNDLGGTKTFLLEVASKNGKKKDNTSKSVTVYPYSWFSSGNLTYKAQTISCGAGSNYWMIHAGYTKSSSSFSESDNAYIYLPNTVTPTSSGIFVLQSDYTNLTSGQACIIHSYYGSNGNSTVTESYISISGQVNILITNNGKVRGVYNNVDARIDNDTTNIIKISGDITCN